MAAAPALVADCSACRGLCCVGPAFAASADFAVDKPAGVPCPHLGGDDGCGIHDRLPERGFRGCVAFDCFGAGQRLTAGAYAGAHWRDGGDRGVFTALETVRALHEILWYLAEARRDGRAAALHDEVDALAAEVDAAAGGDAAALAAVDPGTWRGVAGPLLARVSDLRRGPAGPDLVRADLAGRDLRRRDLTGAGLRGALLIGADLRGVDLTRADLLGADLRGADVRGADLRDALFATRPQLVATRGDATTRLPAWCPTPSTWRVPDPVLLPTPEPPRPHRPARRRRR